MCARTIQAVLGLALPALVASAVCAQTFTLPTLMPGGADQVFDILGVSPGMSCDNARQQMTAQLRGEGPRLYDGGTDRQVTIEGQRQEFHARVISKRVITKLVDEEITVECSPKDALDQVYMVMRRWKSKDYENLSTTGQLKAQLEGKYGPFRSTFEKSRDITYASMYNKGGRLSGPDDSCGRFMMNMPEGALAEYRGRMDPARCSFALYAIFELSPRDRNQVEQMYFYIWDYLRLTQLMKYNAVLVQERRKVQPAPAGPRL